MIQFEKIDAVGKITLKRPEKYNSFVREMHKLPSTRYQSILWTDGRHSVTQLMNWETILKLQKKKAE